MFTLKSVYLAFSAVACQAAGVFLIDPGGVADPIRRALIMAGYLLAIAFIWRNRSNLGLLILGLGLVLNLVVMAANGGLMPVTPEDVARAGLEQKIAGVEPGDAIPGTKNVLVTEGSARLEFLSDALVIPDVLPQQRVVSLGDVLVAVGVVVLFGSLAMRCVWSYTARSRRKDVVSADGPLPRTCRPV